MAEGCAAEGNSSRGTGGVGPGIESPGEQPEVRRTLEESLKEVVEEEDEVDKLEADLSLHLLTKTDGWETKTTRMQTELENRILAILQEWEEEEDYDINTQLYRNDHISFCYSGLKYLPGFYSSLDASRPWIVFWILHSLSLLDGLNALDKMTFKGCIRFLGKCQDPSGGGFGGGPGQYAHLAPTYAAVAALMTLGTQDAYDIIDRSKLYAYLMRMKQPNGAFAVHEDGEIDIRGTYTALATAGMLNLLTPELTENCAEWLSSCQTYEGGMGGEPGLEAHGGYAYCGLAALAILNRFDLIDVPALVHWACARQMKLEGGFQGRTNKLVDSCYSFWVGALFPLIHQVLETITHEQKTNVSNQNSSTTSGRQEQQPNTSSHSFSSQNCIHHLPSKHLFDAEELQKYVLVCCQQENGGLKDKPGKPRDYYHTCYSLSGLSISQHDIISTSSNEEEKHETSTRNNRNATIHPPSPLTERQQNKTAVSHDLTRNVLGSSANVLRQTDALYNVEVVKLRKSMAYYNKMHILTSNTS